MLKLNVFFEIRVMLFEFQFPFPGWYGMASDWRMTLASMHDICAFWYIHICIKWNVLVPGHAPTSTSPSYGEDQT